MFDSVAVRTPTLNADMRLGGALANIVNDARTILPTIQGRIRTIQRNGKPTQKSDAVHLGSEPYEHEDASTCQTLSRIRISTSDPEA